MLATSTWAAVRYWFSRERTVGFNTGTDTGLDNVNDRVNPAANLNFYGGVFQLSGGNGVASTQTFTGAANFLQGVSTAQVNPATGGTAVLTLGNLVRTTGATVIFTGGGSAFTDATGLPVKNTGEIFVTTIGGLSSFSTLSNGILGGWATVGSNFASYNSSVGVVGLGTTGCSHLFGELIEPRGASADNIKTTASISGVTSRTVNSLVVNNATTINMNSSAGCLDAREWRLPEYRRNQLQHRSNHVGRL